MMAIVRNQANNATPQNSTRMRGVFRGGLPAIAMEKSHTGISTANTVLIPVILLLGALMRSFDKRALEEVRRRVVLSELIGGDIKLTRRGREHVGLSPFTEEKTPSFTVSDEKRFWYCFSSKKKGDCFNWLMQYRGLSFPDAVRLLAERTNVDVDQEEGTKPDLRSGGVSPDALLKALAIAARIWQEGLAAPIGAAGREYLARRGIQEESLEAFGLGWCSHDGAGFLERLAGEGIEPVAAYKAGLLGSTRPPRLSFENRVVFSGMRCARPCAGVRRAKDRGRGWPQIHQHPRDSGIS